jgi:hypothetical protein
LKLQDAVDLWMSENHCNPKTSSGIVAHCPRPIIIAAAGGASRAGFFMASIIGYFLQPWDAAKYHLDINDVRNRLFAISSVSGGSMGAVMVTAALNAAKPGTNTPPCVHGAVDQWWGEGVNYWRDCFEALTSGDFLTADFFGFAFNDMLPFPFWRDRAAVLEDSWSNRFRDVIVAPDRDPAACKNLDCAFTTLQPKPGHWIPLLVLNGTSEATGGRIVTTPLEPTYTPRAGKGSCPTAYQPVTACPLFVQAYDFYQLLKEPQGRPSWISSFARYLQRRNQGDDIRMSTAAHNSARFPLISPPGSIRNGDQALVDRIVDGGYFENYGALSAKELALAVHAVQPDLKPLVVVISNDPADLLRSSDDAVPDQSDGLQPVTASHEIVSDVSAPLTTVANSQTAHGILGVEELRSALHAAIHECPVLVIQVRVWPDKDSTHKPLSMSWWESTFVQRQLHRQTEESRDPAANSGADQNQNMAHLQAIWREMENSSCASAN